MYYKFQEFKFRDSLPMSEDTVVQYRGALYTYKEWQEYRNEELALRSMLGKI